MLLFQYMYSVLLLKISFSHLNIHIILTDNVSLFWTILFVQVLYYPFTLLVCLFVLVLIFRKKFFYFSCMVLTIRHNSLNSDRKYDGLLKRQKDLRFHLIQFLHFMDGNQRFREVTWLLTLNSETLAITLFCFCIKIIRVWILLSLSKNKDTTLTGN